MLIKGYSQKQFIVMAGIYLWNLSHPPTIDTYRVNANFDTLSVSYVADFSGPIKVIGKIFSPENYTVSLEVTGVDFDNLFLASPLKFEFPVFIS
ncbi:MAG: hypothetical protein QOK79_11595 [Nitrososphaeraceae archaeon]|nr:hypothetical protein [Nitrososphaeraceae archaeon]